MSQIGSTLALNSSFCCGTSIHIKVKIVDYRWWSTDPFLYYWNELYGYQETT